PHRIVRIAPRGGRRRGWPDGVERLPNAEDLSRVVHLLGDRRIAAAGEVEGRAARRVRVGATADDKIARAYRHVAEAERAAGCVGGIAYGRAAKWAAAGYAGKFRRADVETTRRSAAQRGRGRDFERRSGSSDPDIGGGEIRVHRAGKTRPEDVRGHGVRVAAAVGEDDCRGREVEGVAPAASHKTVASRGIARERPALLAGGAGRRSQRGGLDQEDGHATVASAARLA